MKYHWPLHHPNPVLDEAVDIALDYLEATGRAKIGDDTQYLVGSTVLTAWLGGARHKIRLANDGIVAVQRAQALKPGVMRMDALSFLAIP